MTFFNFIYIIIMKNFILLPTQKYIDKIEAGVDEVGRGCLAGPVVTAAVILPNNFQHILLQDSKKLTQTQREEMCSIIKENAIDYSINFIDNKTIDNINILEATILSMNKSIAELSTYIDNILIDGNKFKIINSVYNSNPEWTYETIIKGDATYANIAAASILAKVTRDNYMIELSKQYPEYGWDKNMGYGTKHHINTIKEYGLTPYHRISFKIK